MKGVRKYRFVAALMSLTLVLGAAAPLIECCLAEEAVDQHAHRTHTAPSASSDEAAAADCHGSTDAPEPADDDCCAYAASPVGAHAEDAIPAASSPVLELALAALPVGEVPSLEVVTPSRAVPAAQDPSPRLPVYLLVSSLLI